MKKYVSKLILDEEGSGLILALMTLMVLAVLGASLGAITIGSHRLGAVNRDDTSAYYIAEAGANQAFEEIESEIRHIYNNSSYSDASSFFNAVENNTVIKAYLEGQKIEGFTPQAGSFPQALVSLNEKQTEENSKTYTIESSGNVDRKNRIVEKQFVLTWIREETTGTLPSLPENASVIARNRVDFLGGKIDGDIYLYSESTKSFNLGEWGTINSENIFLNSNLTASNIFTAPSWRINNPDPNYINILNKSRPTLKIENWPSYEDLIEEPNYSDYKVVKDNNLSLIEENIFIEELRIADDKRVEIKADKSEVNIVINNLNIEQGHINLKGKHNVNLYVLNNFNISGSSTINNKGERNQLNVYYMGNSPILLAGDVRINGNLLVKNADITYSGSGNINGATITGGQKVTLKGGTINDTMIIAFNINSEVKLDNSGTVRGIIITSFLNMKNGTIEYRKFDIDNLPISSKPIDEELLSNEIITSTPVIEPK